MSDAMKTFTKEELAGFNGENGKPVYIAVGGKVYDASQSKLWRGGAHMRRHHSGADMSLEIAEAPHGKDVLERLTQVGVLAPEGEKEEIPALPDIFVRIPFLRRHPHPMTVHFPIVFPMAAAVFTVLYLIFRWKGFDDAALCSLGAGALMTPVAIATGLLTWRINYMSRLMPQVIWKLSLSPVLLTGLAAAFFWRLNTPGILDHIGAEGFFYLLLVLGMAPVVSVIGWFGANLTFPIHDE